MGISGPIGPLTPEQQHQIGNKDVQLAHQSAVKSGAFKGSIQSFVLSDTGQGKIKDHFMTKAQVMDTQKKGMSKVRKGGVLTGIGIGLLKTTGTLVGAFLGLSNPVGWGVLIIGSAIMAKGAMQARTSGAGVEAKSYANIAANAAASVVAGTFIGAIAAQGGAMYGAGSFHEIGHIAADAAQKNAAMLSNVFQQVPYTTDSIEIISGNLVNFANSEAGAQVFEALTLQNPYVNTAVAGVGGAIALGTAIHFRHEIADGLSLLFAVGASSI